jgi:hypothetical protein
MSSSTAAVDLAAKPPSWFAHLPTPKATLQAQEVGSKQPQVLVVDVRRADFEVCFTVYGSSLPHLSWG